MKSGGAQQRLNERQLAEEIDAWDRAGLTFTGEYGTPVLAPVQIEGGDKVPKTEFTRKGGVVGEKIWGWLPLREGQRHLDDQWYLHLDKGVIRGTNWVTAKLPWNWDGEIDSVIVDGQEEVFGLLGYYESEGERLWLARGTGGVHPAWPKLGPGKYSKWIEAGDMVRLGVLKLVQAERLPLAVAWGDKSGQPLGWEMKTSMAQVENQVVAEKMHRIEPLDGWNTYEKGLRVDAWGREV